MPHIFEVVVTTLNPDGSPHIAPMGIQWRGAQLMLAPFRPSTTLNNLRASGHAVINYTNDVRVFAGCITGRKTWPTRPADTIRGAVLCDTLSHHELRVAQWIDDPQRPKCYCDCVHTAQHRPFCGFNRAQAAVIEAAVLASRLHMLAADKIAAEMAYLRIAIDKTAGPAEREAWQWLEQKIALHERATHKQQ